MRLIELSSHSDLTSNDMPAQHTAKDMEAAPIEARLAQQVVQPPAASVAAQQVAAAVVEPVVPTTAPSSNPGDDDDEPFGLTPGVDSDDEDEDGKVSINVL